MEKDHEQSKEIIEYSIRESYRWIKEFMEDDSSPYVQTQEEIDAINWDRDWLSKNETGFVINEPGLRQRRALKYTPEALERLRLARKSK